MTVPPAFRDPDHPLEPVPDLARLRSQCPILPIPRLGPDGQTSTLWMLTRYADVRAMLGSRDTSNGFARGPSVSGQPGFLLSLDPPDHTRIRRLLTGKFSVKRIRALRPRVEEIVAHFLDELEACGPGADLMQTFALPVPSLVICELLGVPFEDRADFQRRSDAMLDSAASPEQQIANAEEMTSYMAELVAHHRRKPGADILGMLIRDHAAEVSEAELIGVGNILLVAGHETTANTIGLGTLLLLQHPDQLALVRDDPSVTATAVEEILRYLAIVDTGTPRLATRDLPIGGQVIPAGDLILGVLPSANRDTAVLADADVFDVTRPVGPHLTFGHGIHQCLGQQLARMELSVAFPALLQRFPDLRLAADPSGLTFRTAGPVNGVRSLPVAW